MMSRWGPQTTAKLGYFLLPLNLLYSRANSLRPPPLPNVPMEKRPNIRDIPARCEDSRAIEPYRILEAGASLGLPERPEMRDTLLFSIKKDARSAKIQLQSNPPPSYAQTLAGRAQKLPSARLLSWYDRAKLRSSWRIVVAVLASRETNSRFSAYAAT